MKNQTTNKLLSEIKFYVELGLTYQEALNLCNIRGLV